MRRYAQTPFSIVNFLSDLVQLLLGVRFLLTFFHANIGNRFVSFVRTLTAPIVSPFTGIFPNGNVSGFTVEWSVVVAMFFYAIVALLIIRVLYLLVDADEDLEESVRTTHV